MLYTESEIVSSYKRAIKPSEQIKILAQLNLVSPKEIKEILVRNGVIEVEKTTKRTTKKPDETTKEGFKLFVEFGQELQNRIEEIEQLLEVYGKELEALRGELKNLNEFMNPENKDLRTEKDKNEVLSAEKDEKMTKNAGKNTKSFKNPRDNTKNSRENTKKRVITPKEKTCVICGQSFMGKGKAKYCPECRPYSEKLPAKLKKA